MVHGIVYYVVMGRRGENKNGHPEKYGKAV